MSDKLRTPDCVCGGFRCFNEEPTGRRVQRVGAITEFSMRKPVAECPIKLVQEQKRKVGKG